MTDSYLVCYDISDPKRLRKVATTCEDFGYRKQLSIFLCRLSATDLVRLRSRLYDIISFRRKKTWWVGNVATSVKPCAARGAEKRRNVGAERQVLVSLAVAVLLATLPTHHPFFRCHLFVPDDAEAYAATRQSQQHGFP